MTVISGASGTGKGTVCKKLLADIPEMFYSISATTRKPRPAEVHGREYFFISVEKFQTWIAEEKFLEYAEVFGNFYGTPSQVIEEKRNAGIDVLLEIDVQGALKVMKKCPDGVYIFLLPPSIEELCNRITNRGTEPPEVVRQRIQAAQKEFATGEKYQYVVVNDSIDAAVEKIKSIIAAEHCRTKNNLDLFRSMEI